LASSSNKTHSSEKNWLIRTRQRQILGPVSKDKLVEFVKKGALGPDDEIASGNGYWFAISEKDLIEKYLFGDVPQSFNPISEAPSVLSVKGGSEFTSSINPSSMPEETGQIKTKPKAPGDEVVLPKDDDLAYPDLDNVSYPESGPRLDDDKAPDSTLVMNVSELKKKSEPQTAATSSDDEDELVLPKADDLEYPE
jgi:hypothetical protein